MTLFKLSVMNLKQNMKSYKMYIFSMVFSIMVFYNFLTTGTSEQFQAIAGTDIISTMAYICLFVLSLFFIFFISYSSEFFVEQRKKEFGVYTFIGVENKSIALLFALEGFLVGMIALIGGITGGILLNKLFLMALVRLSALDYIMKFEINVPSILATAIVFCVILLFTTIREYVYIVRTDVSKLINASKRYQEENTKNKTAAGFIGLAIIAAAYLLILLFEEYTISFMIAVPLTVIFIIIGTMLLFKGFFSFYLGRKINNKRFLYKKTNVVSYNNIVFRIRDNNKSLGAVAILITCCLTSLIVSTSMKTLWTNAREIDVPYSISYLSGDASDNQLVNDAIAASGEEIAFQIQADIVKGELEATYYPISAVVVKYSDVMNIVEHFDAYNKKKLQQTKPSEGEAIVVIPYNIIGVAPKEVVKVGNKELKVKDDVSSSFFSSQLIDGAIIIVDDMEFNAIYEQAENEMKLKYVGITLKDFNETAEITSYIQQHSQMLMFNSDMFNESEYNLVNTLYFLGLFVALVFLLSIGSIMYFKCIADAMKDKEKFSVLRKIGVGEDFIRKAVYKQVGIFFFYPILMGIIHSVIAAYAINDFMNVDASYLNLLAVGLFIAVYVGYYLLTVRKYLSVTK